MGGPLDEPVGTFVREMTAIFSDVTARAHVKGSTPRQIERDVGLEAFNLVAAFVDADGRHSDDELWAVISAFGPRLDTVLACPTPEDLRRAGLVNGKRAWLDRRSTMFDILAATGAGRRYYELAMTVAQTVCSIDDYPASAELDALERFRTLLVTGLPATATPPPATAAAGAAVPEAPQEPARPLDELLEELDGLVGLAAVKAEVKLVANLIQVQNLRRERGLPVPEGSRHLIFTGNPGTGKTTVARLLAQIYRTLKVVEKGHLVETDRSGLVAGFVGQTAIQVRDVFTKALGGVLLIDEAYALARGDQKDFGREAIDTLVKLVEDHRDEIVVIAAGYPDEMGVFVDSNPGLRSRFPKTIYFDDYSTDELVAIFDSLCNKSRYELTEAARAGLRAWLDAQPRGKGFGNGRLARNLFEEAVARQASRIVTIDNPSDEQLVALEAEDIPAVA